MKILMAIAAFVGGVLKWILPAIIKERRKPREVKPVGHDPELQKDIDKGIEDQL